MLASLIACVPGGCGPGTPVSLTTVFGAPSVEFSLGSGFAVVGENSYGTDFGPGSILLAASSWTRPDVRPNPELHVS